jgi:hypothetical protein
MLDVHYTKILDRKNRIYLGDVDVIFLLASVDSDIEGYLGIYYSSISISYIHASIFYTYIYHPSISYVIFDLLF